MNKLLLVALLFCLLSLSYGLGRHSSRSQPRRQSSGVKHALTHQFQKKKVSLKARARVGMNGIKRSASSTFKGIEKHARAFAQSQGQSSQYGSQAGYNQPQPLAPEDQFVPPGQEGPPPGYNQQPQAQQNEPFIPPGQDAPPSDYYNSDPNAPLVEDEDEWY
jgi:hypothetical protein